MFPLKGEDRLTQRGQVHAEGILEVQAYEDSFSRDEAQESTGLGTAGYRVMVAWFTAHRS